jgi:hypothetical protein
MNIQFHLQTTLGNQGHDACYPCRVCIPEFMFRGRPLIHIPKNRTIAFIKVHIQARSVNVPTGC